MKAVTSPWVLGRKSRIHGTGVFARKDIPEGTRVIEYVGRRLTKAQSQKVEEEANLIYTFELNKRYDIDGSVLWNTARWINHSCDPNCESDIIRGRVWIVALRHVRKGEELSYDYGFDLDNWEEHPCRCGASNCRKWIVAEEDWPKLRRILRRRRERVRV